MCILKKICIVVGSRANYSSIKTAMKAIADHPELQLQLIVGASAVLDRYGSVVDLIEKDGFHPDARVYMLIEGESPVTMAKSTGLGLLELPTTFDNLKPDVVLTVGDRFETMATTLAAAYMNIPIAHTMGGEVSGTIDESIRHAITKFAHIHFPASQDAYERIVRLGENPEDIHLVGCPRIDLVAEILRSKIDTVYLEQVVFAKGVGEKFSLNDPFLLISQHPVTTEYGQGELQINETLAAAMESGLPSLVLWPNADAGSEQIAKGIRKWREHGRAHRMFFVKNLPVDIYIHLMSRTACLVGNSSSGIREGAYIGTPTVNIGTRQTGRERGMNVMDVACNPSMIKAAIEKQISNGRYPLDPIYGNGHAGTKIAEILSKKDVNIQKRITY